MKQLLALPLILLVGAAAGSADTILPGTQISVRTETPIIAGRFERGRIYTGHVMRDVYARDGDLAIPRGSPVQMIVRQVGPGEMMLDLQSVMVNGRMYGVDTTGPEFNTREREGGGLVGAIVGAIAGASGGDVQYRGERVRVPEGSVLTFQLQAPLRVFNGYR